MSWSSPPTEQGRCGSTGPGRGLALAVLIALALAVAGGGAAARAATAPGPGTLTAHWRVVDALPGAAAQVALAGDSALTSFASSSPYRRAVPGSYPWAASSGDATFRGTIVLAEGSWTTLLLFPAAGSGEPRLLPIADVFPAPGSTRAAVRFIHASPDLGPLDVLAGAPPPAAPVTVVATSVRLASTSAYVMVNPGDGAISARDAATGRTLLQVRTELAAGSDVTVVAAGAGDEPLRLVTFRDAAGGVRLAAGQRINTGGAQAAGQSSPAAIHVALIGLLGLLVGTLLGILVAALGAVLSLTRLCLHAVRSALAHWWRSVRAVLWAGGAVVLVGAITVALLSGCAAPASHGVTPDPSRQPAVTSEQASNEAPASGPPLVASSGTSAGTASGGPVRLEIPALGLSAPIVTRPVAAAEELARVLPADRVAWLTDDPTDLTPFTDVGAPVLAGHISWGGAPAVFATLDRLGPGDTVLVRFGRGTVTYQIIALRRFTKARFPEAALGPVGDRELRLVTCTGPVGADGLHLDNLVVYAERRD